MYEKPVTADVVVACLFAGIGAWGGTFVQHAGGASTYAAEIFGDGSAEIKVMYPTAAAPATGPMHPSISLIFDNNASVAIDRDGNSITTGPAGTETPAVPEDSEGTVTFELHGAVFGDRVVLADLSASSDTSVISFEDGGEAGESSVTYRIDGAIADGDTFTFTLPRLKGITPGSVKVTSSTVAMAGGAGFPTGGVDTYVCVDAGAATGPVAAGGLVGVKLNADNTITGAVAQGDRPLAPATATAKLCKDVPATAADEAAQGKTVLMTKSAVGLKTVSPADPKIPQSVAIDLDDRTMLAPVGGKARDMAKIIGLMLTTDGSVLQSDGNPIAAELSGDVTVTVTGTRELFGADDAVIVKSGESAIERTSTKKLSIDGTTGQFVGSALPVIFSKPTQHIDIYYMPGGKDDIAHDSEIKVDVAVDFARDTAKDEKAQSAMTVLGFAGVSGELKAYAIPFDGNGKGDMANVRIRCEDGVPNADGHSQCRVFLECWDDDGMRSFGESDPIAEGALNVLNSMEIEEDAMISDAGTRHSCRILATGSPSVQTLVRDGSSGTLVNNSFVEDM